MKITNKIFLLVGMVILAASCKDLLTEDPKDRIDSQYVYSTPGGLESGVTALYNLMRVYNYPGGTDDPIVMNAFFRSATDLGHVRVVVDWAYDQPRFTPSTIRSFKWIHGYKIIDRCNALISNSLSIDMDQDAKDLLIAQVKAMRAETYIDLLTIYDNIVFRTEPTSISEIGNTDYAWADPEDVWALIDSDLDFAISKLDWNVTPGQYGQGVVRHLKGKSALWQENWQEAANQFDAIVDNGTHHLVAVDEVFTGDRNNAESLYTYQFSKELGGSDDLAGGGPTAYAAFFNNRYYELSSGEMIPSVEYGGQSFGWCFPNDYLQGLYDKDNDLRYVTYYYPTTFTVNNPDKANYGQPLPESSYEDNFRRYHFSLKKFHDANKPATSVDSYQNYIHYRFAETLLYGAEAHWRLSGNDADPKALEYINMVRERAFGNANHDLTTFNLDTFLDEDAREMAFENDRWFLLKRLGLLVERVNAHFTVGSNSTNMVHRHIEDYMVRLPIPQSEIELMGTFPQNPGYSQ